MNQNTFRRAREVAEASGLLDKSASIAAGRGLTGAAAVKYAASSFMDGVERLAVEMDITAEADAERLVSKIEAVAPSSEAKHELCRSAKAAGVDLETYIDQMQGQRDQKNNESAARFILGAGNDD